MIPETLQSALAPLTPFLILSLGGLLILILDAVWPRSRRFDAGLAGVPLALAALVAFIHQWRAPRVFTPLEGMYLADTFGAFIGVIVCVSLLLTVLLSQDYLSQMGRYRGEYFALLFFSASGMVLFAAATELLSLFLGLELLSFPVYLLSGYLRRDSKSNEAG
ncbi:MAG: hypothetical protein GF355_13925, partial [Candidatus Eisenbacteria bacterium]|nr:hypothetical protein [Candidatus Eisenbacteria bacterium]